MFVIQINKICVIYFCNSIVSRLLCRIYVYNFLLLKTCGIGLCVWLLYQFWCFPGITGFPHPYIPLQRFFKKIHGIFYVIGSYQEKCVAEKVHGSLFSQLVLIQKNLWNLIYRFWDKIAKINSAKISYARIYSTKISSVICIKF